MKDKILEAAKRILEVREEDKLLYAFARKKYNERFPEILETGWRAFDDYTVLDEDTLLVHYKYGIGDVEYEHSFTVKLNSDED